MNRLWEEVKETRLTLHHSGVMLFCSVIKEGLDLILPESFVVLRGRDGPRLLEPLDTP